MSGTLALVGAGEYLSAMDAVDRWLLARLPANAHVVCLPTAAGTEGDARIRYWMDLGVAHFRRLGVRAEALPIADREAAEDEDHAARIRHAQFVYLSGGKPDYLYDTLAGTAVLTAILDVLDGGGVVAGCSAGAMIWGEQFRSLRGAIDWRPGFGRVVGGVVIPHFDELPGGTPIAAWQSLPTGLSLLGIDRNTALVLADGKAVAIGSGAVSVWNALRRERYVHGQDVTWP